MDEGHGRCEELGEAAPKDLPAYGERQQKPHVRLYVQRRLVCSAGDKPAGVKARSPVARIAVFRETEMLKSIDKGTFRVQRVIRP